jgi:bifunctional ADP-heptose synthase (sugar kinase/adenylyltransferase)
MFKGYDYADKDIIGADKVGEVVIIPCAEDNFFSSSKLVEAIKLLKSDTPPEWSQEPQ